MSDQDDNKPVAYPTVKKTTAKSQDPAAQYVTRDEPVNPTQTRESGNDAVFVGKLGSSIGRLRF